MLPRPSAELESEEGVVVSQIDGQLIHQNNMMGDPMARCMHLT
jgi:hypothetical protein